MDYTESLPVGPLRADVRCFWALRAEAAPGSADPALPDGSPELILNLADPFIAIDAHGGERVQPAVFLVGQITGPFRVRPSGRVDLFGVRFEACGATWLHDDLSALCDDFVDVAPALGGPLEALRRELASVADDRTRAARAEQVLAPLVAAGRRPDWRVVEAVREIRASGGMGELRAVAERLRTTPRTLQRLFARDVGIAPKLLARIVRFQRVFAAWRSDPERLSRVAAECGYSDHAHLVRDFRELAGMPPAAFLANTPEFTRFFTA